MKVFGTFYLKQANDGSIAIGYLNKDAYYPLPKSAIPYEEDKDNYFTGKYKCVWQETSKKTESYLLEIFRKDNRFQLIWYYENYSKIIYFGQGILADNLLIGNYWMGDW